jgi:hypothetical protein
MWIAANRCLPAAKGLRSGQPAFGRRKTIRHSGPGWERMNGDPSPQAMPLGGPSRIFSFIVANFFKNCGKNFQ